MTDTRTDAVAEVRVVAALVGATVRQVPATAVDAPTPCSDFDLRGVLDHLGWAAVLFQHAAAKEPFDHDWSAPGPPPSLAGDPGRWGAALAADLDRTADAWSAPEAWDGDTLMGTSPMPADFTGSMLVAELALHGWDVARAAGLPYAVPAAVGDATLTAVQGMAQMGRDGGWYGPEVPVAADAPAFERALGLSGRDPAWTP